MSTKYKFECKWYDDFYKKESVEEPSSQVTAAITEPSLDDLLMQFVQFLQGAGFAEKSIHSVISDYYYTEIHESEEEEVWLCGECDKDLNSEKNTALYKAKDLDKLKEDK